MNLVSGRKEKVSTRTDKSTKSLLLNAIIHRKYWILIVIVSMHRTINAVLVLNNISPKYFSGFYHYLVTNVFDGLFMMLINFTTHHLLLWHSIFIFILMVTFVFICSTNIILSNLWYLIATLQQQSLKLNIMNELKIKQ